MCTRYWIWRIWRLFYIALFVAAGSKVTSESWSEGFQAFCGLRCLKFFRKLQRWRFGPEFSRFPGYHSDIFVSAIGNTDVWKFWNQTRKLSQKGKGFTNHTDKRKAKGRKNNETELFQQSGKAEVILSQWHCGVSWRGLAMAHMEGIWWTPFHTWHYQFIPSLEWALLEYDGISGWI